MTKTKVTFDIVDLYLQDIGRFPLLNPKNSDERPPSWKLRQLSIYHLSQFASINP